MARNPKDSTVIEWPKKSGIRIRTVRNRKRIKGVLTSFGKAHIVNYPSKVAGRRTRLQFKSMSAAKEAAEKQHAKALEVGRRAFAITAREREDAVRALELLKEKRIDMNLTEVAKFAIPHLTPEGGMKRLNEVIDEIQKSKQFRLSRGTISWRTSDTFDSLSNALGRALGAKWIHDITKDNVHEWLKDIAAEESWRTVKNHRVNAAEIFRHACQKGYLATSPMFKLTREDIKLLEESKDKNKPPHTLSVDEAYRLLDCAFRNPKLKLQGVVVCALFCGVRTEEAQRLLWKNVQLERDDPIIDIPHDMAKKQRARDIDLHPWAVTLFKRIPNRNADDCIAGTEEKDGWYTKRFRKLCQLSGFHIKNNDGKWVSRWGNNAMRHTFATMDYALHLDPARTSRLMGHKRGDDMLFTHYRAKATKQDAERYFNVDGVQDAYLKNHPTPEQLEKSRQDSYRDHADEIIKSAAASNDGAPLGSP